MLFNEGNRLELEDVKFSDEEMAKIKSSGNELFKEASRKLTAASLADLKQYWESNEKSSREMARTLSAFCPKNLPVDSEGYTAVKEALAKSMVISEAIKKMASEAVPANVAMSLDRAPGETAEEHKARLMAYLAEN